jgi:ABC-type amino acid transport substrate-binding protein
VTIAQATLTDPRRGHGASAAVAEAVVYDAPSLGTLKARAPDRYGPFVGLTKTGEHYGVALPKGSAALGSVDAALGTLIADGTIQRLQKKWLTTNLPTLPQLQ